MATYTKSQIAINLLLSAKKCFEQNDLVSAIVLAGAAREILRALCKNRSIEPTIKSLSKRQDLDEKNLHDLIVKTYNKLKHADREKDDVEVCAEEVKVLVLLAATDLMRLDLPLNENITSVLDFSQTLND